MCDNDLNALLRVQNDILKSINNKQCVGVLLLDLSAAFDTVDHKILLQSLRSRFGTRGNGLAWLQSYLTDRSYSVQVDGFTSSVRPLRFGVPQETPRGPCWVRCYIFYTRPHWVTLYDGMIWNSIYMLMTLNCTHLQL